MARQMLGGRRGQEVMSSTTAKILVILLSVIVILLVAANLMLTLRQASGFESCQKSIAIADSNYGQFWEGRSIYNLDCPASHITIAKEDIKAGGELSADDQVNDIIAGEMVRCWRMVGKGEFNPYGQIQVDNTFCLLCSVIEFDKWFRQEWEQIGGLQKYLEESSAEIEETEVTYGEFLQGGWNDAEKVDDIINTSRPYAVFWRMKRIFGNMPVRPEDVPYVGFKPYDAVVDDRCEFIVN